MDDKKKLVIVDMGYDPIGETIQFLQYNRQPLLEEELILKQERQNRVIELYKSQNILDHLVGALFCFFLSFSTKEMPELRLKINEHVETIIDLRDNRLDRAIQLLKYWENYFAYAVETGILLKAGPKGTQLERVHRLKRELVWLQDQMQLNRYNLCYKFLSCVA